MQNATTGTVRIGYIKALLDYLENHQLDTASIFTPELQRQLDDGSMNDRVPVLQWSDLLEKAIAVSGDACLPLRLAEELIPKHWGVFAYAAMTCKNLGEVSAMLVRYERLIDDANDSRVELQGDKVALQWIPRMTHLHPALMQVSLASWVTFARRHTGRRDLVADVDFTCAAPPDVTPFAQLFGGGIRFEQPITQIIFASDYLQLPITYHDPDAHRILVSQVIQQLENLQRPDELHASIRNIISQQVSSGRCSLEQVAAELQVPARTLQYQLEQSGTSFRALLDNTREELARHYLKDPGMSLVDVAFLLGFSEQSPFTKAFKRWTGETPGEYRRHQGQ